MSLLIVYLIIQHGLFDKVILINYSLRAKTTYFTVNIAIMVFGLVDKLIGFDQAWRIKGVIALNMILILITIGISYFIIKGIQE